MKVWLFVIPLILSISQLAADADHAGGGARGVRHQDSHVSRRTRQVHPAFFNNQFLLYASVLLVYVQSFGPTGFLPERLLPLCPSKRAGRLEGAARLDAALAGQVPAKSPEGC